MSLPTRTTHTAPVSVYRGVAVEDLKPGSKILKISCPELLMGVTAGSVDAGIAKGAVSLRNRDNKPISAQITSANHIVAVWDGQSNQQTPPQIKRGEAVDVLKQRDTDKFTWSSAGLGRDVRRTDAHVIEVAARNTKSTETKELDDTNSYGVRIDSENKIIMLKTSKDNGEVCAFNATFNTATGEFYLSDDSESPGNRIYLNVGANGGTPIFQVNLKSGTTLNFAGDNGSIVVKDKLEIKAGKRIVIDSPLFVLNVAKAGSVIINAANVAINASGSAVLAAAALGLNGATKVKGAFLAASAKISSLSKGAVTGGYDGVAVGDPIKGQPSTPGNSPDTDTSGSQYT